MFSPPTTIARRVLIIDDNADAAQLLAMFVAAYGHEAQVANDGPTGLRLAEAFCPEIVFLDLGMPGMSGYEVAAAMRSLPEVRGAYITALTGWNDLKTRLRVVETGFDHHLTKPADLQAVLSLIAGRDLTAA
ncbi:response regulator [Massilia sp. IC2-278]|uniref:response regulator n=1 Tax=Massilia sp. IC2-278 TaxID=2887200 RepID=UPI001E327479|nr:response regulator [Massilia sp. IC2-278]MCC2959584.1 response regulator [Massilia sp. IC2-278]